MVIDHDHECEHEQDVHQDHFRAHIDYARTSSYSCLFLKEKLYIFQSLYFRDAKCLCAFNKVITLYKVEMLKSEMEFVNQAMLSFICLKNVFSLHQLLYYTLPLSVGVWGEF